MRVILPTLAVVTFLLAACAGGEWARVRSQDDLSGYRRFLREHPDSQHAAEARERLEYLQVRKNLDSAAYERFRRSYPQSGYLPDLEKLLEKPLFQAALRQGSADAFQGFLERFPEGRYTPRALANAAYFETGGSFAPAGKLAKFVEQHPESDYAEEVRRTLSALAVRDATRIRTTGLRVEVDAATPGADRLRLRFRDLALEAYQAAGLRLLFDPSPAVATSVDAWITIRHRETAVPTKLVDGYLSGPGLLATTDVALVRAGESDPFWSESFVLRTSALDRRSGTSVLFSARARPYWARFFVPVATWRTSATLRPPRALPAEAIAVDVRGARAAVLFPDGSFQVLNVSDPAQPQVLLDHARPRTLERFSGIRMLGSLVVVYGEDGLEILDLAKSEVRAIRSLDRNAVGHVVAVDRSGDDLLVAGSRGLLQVSLAGQGVKSLLGEAVRDLAVEGDRLALVDDESLYVTGIGSLRQGRTATHFRLGRGFEPRRVLITGSLALVLSPRGLVSLDVSNPGEPRKLSWLRPSQTGVIHDAVITAGRVFLLGERGLQVLDPRAGRILDSVDVEPRGSMALAGRFLVAVGDAALAVVDTTPWTTGTSLAAPAP